MEREFVELAIKIPKERYDMIMGEDSWVYFTHAFGKTLTSELVDSIKEGTPLPKGCESAPVSEWISVDINPLRADNYLVVIEDIPNYERFADVATYCGNGLWQMSEDTILCTADPKVIFWAHVNIPEKEEVKHG